MKETLNYCLQKFTKDQTKRFGGFVQNADILTLLLFIEEQMVQDVENVLTKETENRNRLQTGYLRTTYSLKIVNNL